jgi:hypothetical protein
MNTFERLMKKAETESNKYEELLKEVAEIQKKLKGSEPNKALEEELKEKVAALEKQKLIMKIANKEKEIEEINKEEKELEMEMKKLSPPSHKPTIEEKEEDALQSLLRDLVKIPPKETGPITIVSPAIKEKPVVVEEAFAKKFVLAQKTLKEQKVNWEEEDKPHPPVAPAFARTEKEKTKTAEYKAKNLVITDELWEEIKEKVKKGTGCKTALSVENGLMLVDFAIKVDRNEDGFQVSSDKNPPDEAMMAKSFKIASEAANTKDCIISNSVDTLVTAKLILELAKEPYAMNVIIEKEEILMNLMKDARKECVEALKVYEGINRENKAKLKP